MSVHRSVDATIERASGALAARARADGSWDEACDAGPAPTAQAVLALDAAGALDAPLREGALAWLAEQQSPDGGFLSYPGAPSSDVGSTASVLAALRMLGPQTHGEAVRRAGRFIGLQGGDRAVLRSLDRGDFGAVYLALAGGLDPARLPRVPAALVPLLERYLGNITHVGVPLTIGQLSLVRAWMLAGRPARPEPKLTRLASHVLSLCDEAQNPGGGFVNIVPHTALSLLAMIAAGRTPSDPAVLRAIGWLRREVEHLPEGRAWLPVFHSDVWTTALSLRARVADGARTDVAEVERSLDWLLSAQATTPQARWNQRSAAAERTGGFGFQHDNVKMTDCDDTAVALDAVAACLGVPRLDGELRGRAIAAACRAVRWLAAMQNADGGYPAFVHGLPGKPAGPILTRPLDLRVRSVTDVARLMRDLPLAMGDPSTEDVTARVLRALAAARSTIGSSELGRSIEDQSRGALAFLRSSAGPDGGFWGRWSTNYLWATAHVVLGAISAGQPPGVWWVRRAIDYLVHHANDDGGFGEAVASYRDPRLAGRGLSMPAVTGLVLEALVAAGEHASVPAARAVAYLLRTQRADGAWPDAGHVQVILPPDGFYRYPAASQLQPLLGLAAWRSTHAPIAPRGGPRC